MKKKVFFWAKMVLCAGLILASSCGTTQKVKNGSSAYQSKQYAKAIELLQSEILSVEEGSPEYAEYAYMLGQSYKNVNDSPDYLRWMIQAAKYEYGPEAYVEMAYALKKNERYEDAILTFQRLARITGQERQAKEEIKKCREALALTKSPIDTNLVLQALSINSPQGDYAPAYLSEGLFVFTSDRPTKGETYAWTGNSYSDLYVADFRAGSFQSLEGVNTEHNEGTASFSSDRQKMVFTRCDRELGDNYCSIYISSRENDQWTKGERLFDTDVKAQFREPVFIEEDSVLIFTSNLSTGVGGHDLYYSVLMEDKEWSTPELMPTYLNTTGNERYPTWDENTRTLYYSSDHLGGLGGLDIYKTVLSQQGKWSRPQNVEPPINSSEDDFSLIHMPAQDLESIVKSRSFFTSTRGVFGSDDIYMLEELYPADYVPLVESDTTETIVEEEDENTQYYLRMIVTEKLFAIQDNPNSYVVGSKRVGGALVKINDLQFTADGNGVVIMPMDSIEQFRIIAGLPGYLNNIEDISITRADKEGKPDRYAFDYTIMIEREFAGIEIVIDNIFYDFNKSNIREDAKPALNKIVKLLKDNPNVHIELASHTDCQGPEDYNLNLSQERAASAAAYIVSQMQIDASRIASTGYGETRLEIACECDDCSEEEHQINRRTTFKIIR